MCQQAPDEISITPRRDSPVGRRMTLAFGWIAAALVLLALVGAVLVPILVSNQESINERHRHYCLSNGKQLGNALLMYTQDYDDRLPPANMWEGGLWPYVKNPQVFICPQRPRLPGYAFNAKLHLRSEKTMLNPAAAPAIYESGLGIHNGCDYLQSLLTPHAGKGTVVFADGHAQLLAVAPPAAAGLKDTKQ